MSSPTHLPRCLRDACSLWLEPPPSVDPHATGVNTPVLRVTTGAVSGGSRSLRRVATGTSFAGGGSCGSDSNPEEARGRAQEISPSTKQADNEERGLNEENIEAWQRDESNQRRRPRRTLPTGKVLGKRRDILSSAVPAKQGCGDVEWEEEGEEENEENEENEEDGRQEEGGWGEGGEEAGEEEEEGEEEGEYDSDVSGSEEDFSESAESYSEEDEGRGEGEDYSGEGDWSGESDEREVSREDDGEMIVEVSEDGQFAQRAGQDSQENGDSYDDSSVESHDSYDPDEDESDYTSDQELDGESYDESDYDESDGREKGRRKPTRSQRDRQ